MSNFQRITKDNVNISKKPRVFFTCHPADFNTHFDRICKDIFKTHDCAIYFTQDMSAEISPTEQETDLGRCNLLVVPVTRLLLTTPNRAMEQDIPYARNAHIPILPIMTESNLDALYRQADKFSNLQYLSPHTQDDTEISYENKLRNYLNSVLIDDDLAARIRAAFDAYIFLSYRKKDRKYANELMRLIHSNPECRDIAIWFDEFLTPGEDFKENISRILENCQLFALLITPHLLEKVIAEDGQVQDNYVLATELPLALQKKANAELDIFAVEMEDTDKAALASVSIEDYVKPGDAAFRERLLQAITRLALTENHGADHDFLIGLAYLEGIDVEVDRDRGLRLITQAAEAGLPEAMMKLYQMYTNGHGISVDYQKALYWQERLAEHYKKTYGDTHCNTCTILNELALAYDRAGQPDKALVIQEAVYARFCEDLGKNHTNTLKALNSLGHFYSQTGQHEKAIEIFEEVYQQRRIHFGEDHPDTLTVMSNLSSAYSVKKMHQKALEMDAQIYASRCRVLGEEHPHTLISLNNLGCSYLAHREPERAADLLEKAYALRCNVLGEEHPETMKTLGNLANAYNKCGNKEKVIESSKKVFLVLCKTLGDHHPDTLISLHNLVCFYSEYAAPQKALPLLKDTYIRFRELLGETHEQTMDIVKLLGKAYATLQNNNMAKRAYIRLLESYKERGELWNAWQFFDNLYYSLSVCENPEMAVWALEQAYSICCQLYGEDSKEAQNAYRYWMQAEEDLS